MNKFLFTDGINGVQKTESVEELESLIESSQQPDKIRIWIFSTNEWIPLAVYRKKFPLAIKKHKASAQQEQKPVISKKLHWSKKLVYTTAAAAGVFLIFNFTKIKWEHAGTLNTSAVRPVNVPEMDIDSLINEIEYSRGQFLDRSTRTNLRLRNTWPDRILLNLNADKESSSAGTRFYNLKISVDNTTGFPLDEAVVRLMVWKNNKPEVTDTFHFGNIRFDRIAVRQTDERYKGDSISLDFKLVKAKAFNFSYSVNTKNEPGEYNDRWFSKL